MTHEASGEILVIALARIATNRTTFLLAVRQMLAGAYHACNTY